jgi:uncharacterized OsmC-like protein
LTAEARGEIEKDGKVIIIRRIHVTYCLKVTYDQRETAERVHGFHADYCPVARSVRDSIAISTTVEFENYG